MFTDMKDIETEIEQFRKNMNSVDGLMDGIKSVCGKMDYQINQADQLVMKNIEIENNLQSDMGKLIDILKTGVVSNEKISKELLGKVEVSFYNYQQLLQNIGNEQTMRIENLADQINANYLKQEIQLKTYGKRIDLILENNKISETKMTMIQNDNKIIISSTRKLFITAVIGFAATILLMLFSVLQI